MFNSKIMREIKISIKRQITEVKWIVASFFAAFLLNVISIIVYDTSWSEIFTQILWVLVISCVIYGISVGIRFLYYLIRSNSGGKRS